MATQVYKQVTISLQDGKEVTVKPLPIGRLRRFMDAWQKFSEVENDDDGFTVFVNCAGIALEDSFKGDYEKVSKAEQDEGKVLADDYVEYLEDVLDLDTIYEILDVAGGIKLNDPKLLEQAASLSQEKQ